jgi:hypothetical protein
LRDSRISSWYIPQGCKYQQRRGLHTAFSMCPLCSNTHTILHYTIYTLMQKTHTKHIDTVGLVGGCLLMQKRCSRPSSLGQPSSPRSQFGEWLSLFIVRLLKITNPFSPVFTLLICWPVLKNNLNCFFFFPTATFCRNLFVYLEKFVCCCCFVVDWFLFWFGFEWISYLFANRDKPNFLD